MDHVSVIVLLRPPFSSGIFQLAMFDETRGYPFPKGTQKNPHQIPTLLPGDLQTLKFGFEFDRSLDGVCLGAAAAVGDVGGVGVMRGEDWIGDL